MTQSFDAGGNSPLTMFFMLDERQCFAFEECTKTTPAVAPGTRVQWYSCDEGSITSTN